MRILISGASGFIGAPLSAYLAKQGHHVIPLIHSKQHCPKGISWDPEAGNVRKEDFEGFDAVIHLAGEPLSLHRWSSAMKQKILYSRTVGTWFLSHILASLHRPPKTFICASAVGYYGDRGEEIVSENASPGHHFLSRVCVEWERASQAIENRGARVVHARFGVVLGPRGGLIRKILPLYRLGLGAVLGSGDQWMSWVSLADLIGAIDWLLQTEESGPFNITSPHPVRQKTFSHEFASLFKKPSFIKIPSWLLRWGLGDCAETMILSSIRALPEKLLTCGFSFRYPSLNQALVVALENPDPS